MKKIDWTAKLSSRKFWAAIGNFASMLLVALGFSESQAAQIAALIMAGGGVIAWIVAEGMVDAARIKAEAGACQEMKPPDPEA